MQAEKQGRIRTYWLIGATLLSLLSYHLLIYQTPRHDPLTVFYYFIILAVVYLAVVRITVSQDLYLALWMAILLRFSLLWAVPELSDDFFRFIWDGRLLTNGISPFAALPSELMEAPSFHQLSINQQLFQGMNSPDYFTVYPPISQWVFFLAAWIFPDNILGNIMVMRLIIVLCEGGSIWLLLKLLQKYQIDSNKVLIYAWNPLVIVELTGNLHFEAIMIFLVLLAIYLFKIGSWKWSAVSIGAGVAVKLIPLIFLPLLMFRMSWRKLIAYWTLAGVTILVLFFTVWSPELLNGMKSSLSLYFQNFEFNASIYYLIREVGFAVKGYNIIASAGKFLGFTTLVLILVLSWHSHKWMTWPKAMLWALTVYLLMSTTVHPWYITPLVALAVFSDYKFPIIWSILVIISYLGYTETGYQENLTLVAAEYIVVLGVLIWDLKQPPTLTET